MFLIFTDIQFSRFFKGLQLLYMIVHLNVRLSKDFFVKVLLLIIYVSVFKVVLGVNLLIYTLKLWSILTLILNNDILLWSYVLSLRIYFLVKKILQIYCKGIWQPIKLQILSYLFVVIFPQRRWFVLLKKLEEILFFYLW